MTRIFGLCALIASLTAAAARHETSKDIATVGCRAMDSATSDFKNTIVDLVTATDSASAADRQNWSLLTASADDVYFVNDSSSCDRAARIHAAKAMTDTINPAPVSVLRAGGQRYVVFNWTREGEFFMYVVVDSSFSFLKAIVD